MLGTVEGDKVGKVEAEREACTSRSEFTVVLLLVVGGREEEEEKEKEEEERSVEKVPAIPFSHKQKEDRGRRMSEDKERERERRKTTTAKDQRK